MDNAADEFDEVYPTDSDKIDLIRQRYSLRRAPEYSRAKPQEKLDTDIVVEFRTFGEIDPAFIQYTDSFHDLDYVKHDDMWLFSAALVEEHEGKDPPEDAREEEEEDVAVASKRIMLSPRPQIDTDILLGRGKRTRRASLIAVGE